MLLIDFREREFISHLSQYTSIENNKEISLKINNIDILIKICSLPIGDFVIQKQEDIKIIIERKTLPDLSASIIDGRFREQKERLFQSIGDGEKILYIIEEKNGSKTTIPQSTLDSAILNLMYKHKYKVLQTKDSNETFNNIILLYKKMLFEDNEGQTNTRSQNKMIVKKDKISENMFINQLCIIPGVSPIIAKVIKIKYNTMHNLIKEWEKLETSDEKEMMLTNLQITEKRKIGKALSKKIYHAHYTL